MLPTAIITTTGTAQTFSHSEPLKRYWYAPDSNMSLIRMRTWMVVA